MDITSLLSPERIACETEVSSKKRAFERLAEMLASDQTELEPEAIFDALINREKLGSTTLGNGVAIPHACRPIHSPRGALLLLQDGIKMDTPDKKPVQLFMAILVPTEEQNGHTHLITELTSILLQKSMLEQISQFHEPKTVMDYLVTLFNPPEQRFAA
ncbi:MAG: PTS sugar transporter subunit IIA [Gammaproteobacteria bacterium]|nr:PTS sugar transporter subunit IIA [Gammaproteobacteria bacterium]MBU1722762.1 PTS sugar transporter subunit IIA [Gammaproteobacteria bacterium]MBU2005211.1 PTS sugar transporter subunit IIA [Gammaproteobacteria bacterium]